MVWTKLDDGVLDHPKVAAAGPIGWALWSASLVYANRNLTDGFVPYAVARRLLALEWTDPTTEGDNPKVWNLSMTSGHSGVDGDDVTERTIAALCTLGLWDEVPHGYLIHDFDDWNPSKEKVLADREKTAERVKRHRNAANNGGSNAVTTALVSVPPVPGPEPEPLETPKAKARKRVPVNRPDDDQAYLVEKISEETNTAPLSMASLQKLNAKYGRPAVTDALRYMRGFPPEVPVRNAYAYVEAICKDREATA